MTTSNTTMRDKVCLITGATSGIGKVTALELAKMGATVVMVSRDRTKGEEARQEIIERSGNTSVDLLQADLASLASVRQLAEQFKQKYQHLHVLINNAGAVTLNRQVTAEGFERTFAINYLAPFLLTNLLLDTLKASAPARIVNVSSDAQQSGYINFDDLQMEKRYKLMDAYSQSKVAITMFTYELAKRLQGTGVTANCLHPGFVKTNIGQSGNNYLAQITVKLVFSLGISPEEGAKTTIYLASSPDVANVTGKYFVKSIPKLSAPITYDESAQRRLWEISAQMVKLPTTV